MTDPRQDDLRTTYDEVTSGLEELAETEARKQATRPGTEHHVRLARKAEALAKELRHSTAIETELAEELEADPGRSPPRAGMATYKVGYFVGSLSSTSINRELSKALIRLAPDDMVFTEIHFGNLPLYSPDYDADFPTEARAFKESIAASDAILFVTPEYNRSIPGALKNAIDWASRPGGQNSFNQMAAAVIGTSRGQIGTAMAQQSLRGVLSFCNARQMTAPEAYIRYSEQIFPGGGEVADESTRKFLANFMDQFRIYIERVLTVIPRT